VPTPSASSEAQTLASESAGEIASLPRDATEPFAAIVPALPSALDSEIDVVFARASSEPVARAAAPATRVIDATLETSVLEPARLKRMLEEAPLAAHAQAPARDAERAFDARARRAQLLWAAAVALALALTVGIVRLASRTEGAPAQSAAEAAAVRAPAPDAAQADLPEASEPPREILQAEPVRVQPKRAQPEPRTTAGPAAPEPMPAEEESGWVIRR
jgi:hypothetical protein